MKNPTWSKDLIHRQRSLWSHEITRLEAEALINAAPHRLEALVKNCLIKLEEDFGIFLLSQFPQLPDSEAQKSVYLYFGELMGQPVLQDRQGSRVVDIRKTAVSLEEAVHYKAKSDGQLSRPYETDVAFSCHSDPCDVAGLLCLQAAAVGGETQIINAFEVWQRLEAASPHLSRILCEPFPYARPGKDGSYHQIPIVSWREGYFKCHVVPELIWLAQSLPGIPKLTHEQKEALTAFTEMCQNQDLAYQFRLKPGDLLLVNNHLILHGRSRYQDETTQVRHMLRLWLAVPNSRPLHTIHQSWFGSCEAGAKRGGYG